MADELEALLKTFDLGQLKFLECLLDYPKITEAAKAAGIDRSTYYKWENRADIDRAAILLGQDGVTLAREYMRRKAAKAAQTLTDNLDSRNPQVRHAAAVEVLNRTVGKPTDKSSVETTHKGEVTLVVRRVKSDGLLGFTRPAPSAAEDRSGT